MIVDHGSLEWMAAKKDALGPDPLREDADSDRFMSKVKATKRPIGALLMDQAVLAGIGNIYRAEILFKSGIHPEIPGSALSRQQVETIWSHSVALLQRGFASGSILTVDAHEGTWQPAYLSFVECVCRVARALDAPVHLQPNQMRKMPWSSHHLGYERQNGACCARFTQVTVSSDLLFLNT